ncbi:hypothetical protein EBR57_08375, partial [bacterium]|nr:hypothetical protein [bacterium]
MKKRAVVTGMGMVCALGLNREEIFINVEAGKSGLKTIRSLDLETLSTQVGGEVTLPEDIQYPDSVTPHKASRLAYLAFTEAWKESGLDASKLNLDKLGLSFGTCNGNVLSLEHRLAQNDAADFSCQDHFDGMDFVAVLTGAKGPKMLFVTACAASNHAIGYAQELIANGEATVVIVGGADSFSLATFAGFHALQSFNPTGTAPFSDRVGISLGEGAGFLIVEEESHALGRNAEIHGEILGYSFRGDAYHATSPDNTGNGACRTMSHAIAAAGIQKSEIAVICAHGTGTEANDRAESLAIKNCFGDHAYQLKVTSTKSLYGHTLGAAGVTQVIMMFDCMNLNFVPPIVNFQGSRDECDLDYVRNNACQLSYDYFVSNSFAFGGNNVSVVLGKYKPHKLSPVALPTQPMAITDFEFVLPHIQTIDELKLMMQSADAASKKTAKFEGFKLTNPQYRKYGKSPLISRLSIEAAGHIFDRSDLSQYAPDQIGILMGILKGPIRSFERFFKGILNQGIALGSALDFPNVVMNSVVGQVSIALGIKGVNTVVAGQFSPFAALLYADIILKQSWQGILVCGCDEEEAADGAASLLVEAYEAAIGRNRPILALVDGVHTTSFPRDTNWGDSFRECIAQTLQKADISVD